MRILSFDGAMASALQIRLLYAFEQQCPGLLRKVDLFAGASDGAYMALYLALNRTNDDLKNLKVLKDAIAFSNGVLPIFHLTVCKVAKFVSGWLPILNGKQLRRYFEDELGPKRLDEMDTSVLAVALDALSWRPRVFSNLKVPHFVKLDSIFSPSPGKVSAVDTAMASSAMPLTFPMARVAGMPLAAFVDGGMVANNPTMVAMTHAAESLLTKADDSVLRTMSLLRVLSLGAVESPMGQLATIIGCGSIWEILYGKLDWGWIQWLLLRPLLLPQLVFQGPIALVHYECKRLLGDDKYRRIEPPLPFVADMAALMLMPSAKVASMLDDQAAGLTQNPVWMDANVKWIQTHFLA